jgi:hypothetical protein
MATATFPCSGRAITLPERRPEATTDLKTNFYVGLLCIFTERPQEFRHIAHGFGISGLS